MRAVSSSSIPSQPWFRRLDLTRYVRTILFDIMVLLACTMPGIIFAHQHLQEPWNAFRVARAQLSINHDRIADYTTSAGAYRPEHLGSDLLHTALIQATGLPLDSLVFAPIGALILALAYYGIAFLLTSSRWWAAGIALFSSWYYPGIYNQFGTQTYVWVYSLLLGFLIIFFQWLKQPKRVYEVLLTMLFLATFLHYHTTPLWMIGLMMIGVGGSKIAQRRNGSPYRYSWLLPFSWLAWDVVFDSVLRHGWQQLQTMNSTMLSQNFLSKVFGPLLQRTPTGLDPFEVAPINPPLATWSTLLCLMLLTVPVGWWIIVQVRTLTKTRQITTLVATPHHRFVWSISGIAIAHTTMYLMYGALSLRVIPVLFPLVVAIIWREQPWKYWGNVMLVLLVASAMIGFFSYTPTMQQDITAQQTGRASSLIAHSSTILSDANLYGSLALQSATNQEMINLAWIDATNYRAVVEGKALPQSVDYIAIAKTTKPLITTQWQYFAAWMQSNAIVEQHPLMNQIYASSFISLLQPSEQALPTEPRTVFQPKVPSWLGVWGRLIGTILAFFLIPGVALFWIAQRKQVFGHDLDIRVILGCTVAFSVLNLTMLSYLVQLSGVGIRWIGVLTLLLPLGILMIVRLQGKPFTIAARWWRYGMSVLIVLSVWSGFATQNVMAQTTDSPAVEVFATQASAGSLIINVANNTIAQTNATVVIERSDGTELMTTNQLLPANTVTTISWTIPMDNEEQAVIIRVLTEKQPALTLWFAHLPAGK